MNRIIHWFVENPIAANLIMLIIIIGGIINTPKLNKEFFPRPATNIIQISVPYPGAGPKEVEEQVCIRLEEAIHDLDGIEKISSVAYQGAGIIRIEVVTDFDSQRLLNEVKARVDALNTLPREAERPLIQELLWHQHMLSLALAGNVSEKTLKVYGEKIRDELAALPSVSIVKLQNTRAYEISIEVSEYNLKRYGIRFEQVVQAIRDSSLNLPAGSIKAKTGNIQLQARGQAYQAIDFENIILRRKLDGSKLLLGDVAKVIDDFEDKDFMARFNGEPAVFIDIKASDNPDVLKTSKVVQAYVDASTKTLPDALSLTMWRDSSYSFKARISTLLRNGLSGLVLVYIVLMLFLRPMLALWVCYGIGVAFLGTLGVMGYFGISLNMMSLFAFLLILGIVVDDAIVVGESVYREQQMGLAGKNGASTGTQKISKPIMFAVISTMIVFLPMYFLPGHNAKAAISIPTVVLLTLCFSLIEALFILPSHLSHLRALETQAAAQPKGLLAYFEQLRQRCEGSMSWFCNNIYAPALRRALSWHWLTLAGFNTALMISIAIFLGGWIQYNFVPHVTSDSITASITLADGSPFSDSQNILRKVEAAAMTLKDRHQYSITEGEQKGQKKSLLRNIQATAYTNKVNVRIEMERDKRSSVSVADMSREWREEIGELGNIENFDLSFTVNRRAKALQFVLTGLNSEDLTRASKMLQTQLKQYPGIYETGDSMSNPRPEIELNLKPMAENLAVNLAELARQVRQGFYGAEAQRIPRGKEDVKVMVRYPRAERESPDHFQVMQIRTPQGIEVPFNTVAEINYVPSFKKIDRLDRQRIITVSAEIDTELTDPSSLTEEIMEVLVPRWQQQLPGLKIKLHGEQLEKEEFNTALFGGTLKALLAIYGLFAIVFRSYWQPFIILTAVPFGFMGAIFGHLIMGLDISIFSLLGILACAGVVVNDNLVLIDRINQLREHSKSCYDAIVKAAVDRFRPIILTSLTTFIGLLPIMSETSLQAQFLIPMVTSLAFGVLFATGITLFFVPCLYLIGEQIKQMPNSWRLARTRKTEP